MGLTRLLEPTSGFARPRIQNHILHAAVSMNLTLNFTFSTTD